MKMFYMLNPLRIEHFASKKYDRIYFCILLNEEENQLIHRTYQINFYIIRMALYEMM